MDNLWRDLTSLPPAEDTFSVLVLLYFALFAIGFIGSVVLANRGSRRIASHPVQRRAIQHCANIGMYVFAAGIFFFGVRALNINPFAFGSPLWLWLSLLAVVVFALYCLWYWRTTVPVNRRAFEERQMKERYLRPIPAAHRRPASAPGRPPGAAAKAGPAPREQASPK